MVSTIEISWLAGILEGEGAFTNSGKWQQPKIMLKMTDMDVVAKVAALFCRKMNGPYKLPSGKAVWVTTATDYNAISWMYTLYTFLGIRRRQKIREIVATWKSRPGSKATQFKKDEQISYILQDTMALLYGTNQSTTP